MDFWSSGDIPKIELADFHIPSPTLSWKYACNFVLKIDIVWPHPKYSTRQKWSDIICQQGKGALLAGE